MTREKYYNRFTEDVDWASIDFIAGRRVQSAELNEIQSIADKRIRDFGNSYFGVGHIIDGCQPIVNTAKTQIKITDGRLYLEGQIMDSGEQTITITGQGTEVIGVKLVKAVLTYETNPELLDPAVLSQNFGLPGAERTQMSITWLLNDVSATTIYTLVDGAVTKTTAPPELEGITPILSRRTYDTSGNFLVSGMDAYKENIDDDTFYLVVEAGKAYVKGREINLPVPIKTSINKAKSTRSVADEMKTYLTGTTDYTLNSLPVKQITQLTATVEVTRTITRGSVAGSMDDLPDTPVVQLVEVKQGGTTYSAAADYQLTGNRIDWGKTGAEPAGGSSYTVKYRYTKIMIAGTDYSRVGNNVHYLDGDRPVDGTQFLTDYDYYLARRDAWYINELGEVKVIGGQSEIYPYTPPVAEEVLGLGEMYLPPNSDDVVITNYKPKRLTVLDQRKLLTLLEQASYNQAITNLDQLAQGTMPANKGMFTDNFSNFDRSDKNHADYKIAMDPDKNTIMLRSNRRVQDLQFIPGESTVAQHERFVSAPSTERLILQQLKATESKKINQYLSFPNRAVIKIDPQTDNWFEESSSSRFETVVLTTGWNWSDTSSVTKELLNEEIVYMRSRVVTIKGENWEPNTDNISATFDGVKVALTPVSPTVQGTILTTVKADAQGKFTATFTIPEDTIKTGTREVRLFSLDNGNDASAAYTATGKKIVSETVTTQTFYYHFTTRWDYYCPVAGDPLAESFQLPEDRHITAVSVFFKAKSATKPVTIQIRNTENGYPGAEVYASKTLQPAQINVSANSSAETKFVFDDPVICKANTEYVFVVMTDSADPEIYVARMGYRDILTSATVEEQPYTVGVMCSSSNNTAWTIHQDYDIKFKMYSAEFQPEQSYDMVFQPVALTDISKIMIGATEVQPQGGAIQWFYSLDAGANYYAATAGNLIDLPQNNGNIKVKASIKGKVSPMLVPSSVLLVAAGYQNSGAYVSLRKDTDAFTSVTVYVDMYTPSGTTQALKYSLDDTTWVSMGSPVESKQVDHEYNRCKFTANVSSSTHIRFKLEMTSSDPIKTPKAKRLMALMT